MILFYDRSGVPIAVEQWGRLYEDLAYRRVGLTRVVDAADPAVALTVSTVWMGTDHNWGLGVPLIFETMVFGEGFGDSLGVERWATDAQAVEGHAQVVAVIASRMTDAVITDEADQPGTEVPSDGQTVWVTLEIEGF